MKIFSRSVVFSSYLLPFICNTPSISPKQFNTLHAWFTVGIQAQTAAWGQTAQCKAVRYMKIVMQHLELTSYIICSPYDAYY